MYIHSELVQMQIIFATIHPSKTLNCPKLREMMLKVEDIQRLAKVTLVSASGLLLAFTAVETKMR